MLHLRVFVCLSSLVALCGSASADVLLPVNLRCEYRVDPLGIDEVAPRLSWELEASNPDRRGQHQTAYEIVVASSEAALDEGDADVWSTGVVESNQTNQIVYGGPPLRSRQQCWWKVRSWNERDEPSSWSKPARWSMGLLDATDWKAHWIGYDAPADEQTDADERLALDDSKWVWHEPAAPVNAEQESRFFRHVIELPRNRVIKEAAFFGTADDRLELFINGVSAGRASTWRQLHRIDITPHLVEGRNAIAIHVENDVGSPAGLVGRLRIDFEQGEAMTIDVDGSWKASAIEAAAWKTSDFDDRAWANAAEIGEMGDAPWGTLDDSQLDLPPPPQFRKRFTSDKPVQRATMYATALGLYDLHINGKRVGDVEFAPGWTDYRKRVYYHTYDVTDHIVAGENVVTTLLGDGWYSGYVGYGLRRNIYGDKPRLMMQLEIEYADGSIQSVVTDGSWKAAYGPVREADMLMGWTYDASRETRWTEADFDDSAWAAVEVGSEFDALIEAYPGAPARRQEEIPAATVFESRPGVYVFDLRQNMVGWVRLKGMARAGQPITIRHAEMLNPDNTLYTVALRGARATDVYVPAADGEFEFEPEFTFHGFQYVEVTGLDVSPDPDAVTGIVVNADMAQTGRFESSEPMVNQLFHNIIWGQKGNYLEVPTDCPQRDERLGWTGDAQFFIPTASYNFDVAAFYTKWLIDLVQDSQNADGAFASVAPDVLDFSGAGATGWADAGIICPYNVWQFYGDTRIIERHYDAMAHYIEYLEKTSNGYIREQGAYGDWVNLGGGAKSEVIGTAYFSHVAALMAEMAEAIGREDDARRYRQLAQAVREAFIENFVGPDGRIEDSSQTGYALAFTMDLLPPDAREAAAKRFIEEIAAKDWHLATGFIGTPRLLPALTLAGHTDIAYRLFLTHTYPSWLYQVTLGATTMWERWDGWTPEKGFQTPVMNSFNHYAFGSVGEWMYATVAGIESDGPGFRRIVIRPQPGPGLTAASARYHSINGEIVSEWSIDKDGIRMKVRIPPNSTARVHVPTANEAEVTEANAPAAKGDGVKFIRMQGSTAVFEVGSGSYEFHAPLAARED